MRIVMDYHWPGNVRELENAIEHAFVLCSRDRIDVFDLPVEIRQTTYQPLTSEAAPAAPKPYSRGKKFSREELIELLDACDWNKAEVARRIGLSRTAVWKYMKNLGIPLKKPV